MKAAFADLYGDVLATASTVVVWFYFFDRINVDGVCVGVALVVMWAGVGSRKIRWNR